MQDHAAEHQDDHPDVDQTHPVVHHALATREHVGVAGRELRVGFRVAAGAGLDDVVLVDRGRRVED